MTPIHSILIVGVGSIGERHLRCFQHAARASLGICEVNASLRTEVARRYGVERCYASIDDAPTNDFSAAVIATPAPFHIPLARQAVDRGMHVLIEKPLSIDFDGVKELIQAAARRQVTTAMAYVMRCHPALAAAREAVLSGRFGPPLQIVTVSGQNFPLLRPAYRDTYYAKRGSGGGAVQDALTHFVNAVQWLVGPMDCVMADVAHLSLPGVEVEDTVHVIARHGEVLASYALNQHQAPNESTITVVCEQGVVRIALHSNRWAYFERGPDAWIEQSFHQLQRDDLFTRQANAFLDAVDAKSAPLCTLDEGAQTLQANMAILAAADHAAWTTIPTRPSSEVS